MMCIALLSVRCRLNMYSLFVLTYVQLTSDEEQPSPERMSLNFNRRYKWLLDPTEDYPENLIFPFLSLDDFIADLEDVRQVCSCLVALHSFPHIACCVVGQLG